MKGTFQLYDNLSGGKINDANQDMQENRARVLRLKKYPEEPGRGTPSLKRGARQLRKIPGSLIAAHLSENVLGSDSSALRSLAQEISGRRAYELRFSLACGVEQDPPVDPPTPKP